MQILELKFGKFLIFMLSISVAFCCSFVWLIIGEKWGLKGDAPHYIALYNGSITNSPFGYRTLTPWLARLFSSNYLLGFKIVLVSCLSLTSGVISLLVLKKASSLFQVISIVFFWITSFAFVYYTTTIVRPDSVMLLMLASLFLAANYRVHPFILIIFLGVGIFAHETILIFIPIIWLDKFGGSDLSGGLFYSIKQLVMITVCALIMFFISRQVVTVLPAAEANYWSNPIDMLAHSVNHNGGVLKQLMRIYAAFGPALLYCFFFIVFKSKSELISFVGMFIIGSLATLMATDTLRIISIIYVPVIFYASEYVLEVWSSKKKFVAFILLGLQLLYSVTVYGHLRTFEKSAFLNTVAVSLSLLAFIGCALLLKQSLSTNALFKGRGPSK
jgi:hypothetical protein